MSELYLIMRGIQYTKGIKSHALWMLQLHHRILNAQILWGIETRVINNNLEHATLHSSDLLVKETEEHMSTEEANK